MSAEPASNPKEQLHALVDSISDERAEGLLLMLETDLAPPAPLSPYEIERTRQALEESRLGLGIPHDEVMRRFGLQD